MKLYNVEDSDGGDLLNSVEEEPYEAFEEISSKQSRINKFSQFVI